MLNETIRSLCRVVLDIGNRRVRSEPAALLNNTYLGIERIDLLTIETGVPEFALAVHDRVPFLSTCETAVLVRARHRRGGGRNGGIVLWLTLAARRTQTMFVGAMGLAADGASEFLATRVSRVSPLPALLADGDADLRRGAANEAFAVPNNNALAMQAAGAGTGGGVPDVEVRGNDAATFGLLDETRRGR